MTVKAKCNSKNIFIYAYAHMLIMNWFVEHLSYNIEKLQTILQMFTSAIHTNLQ